MTDASGGQNCYYLLYSREKNCSTLELMSTKENNIFAPNWDRAQRGQVRSIYWPGYGQ